MSQITRTFSNSGPGGFVQTLTGDTGGAVGPTAGNINVIAGTATQNSGSTIAIVGNPGTSTLELNVTDAFTNIFFGFQTGNPATASGNNVGFGYQCFQNIIGVGANTAFGWRVQTFVTTGDHNTVMGHIAGGNMTTGTNNTIIGSDAFVGITGGNNNTIIGNTAGVDYGAAGQNNSNNILIGQNCRGAVGAENNTLRIGNTTGGGGTAGEMAAAFICGIDGINVGSTAKVVTMGTGATANKLGTAVITAGAGIVVTPGANTITISTIGGGLTWSVISVNQTAVVDNGYFCNKAGTLSLLLPAVSAVGDEIQITNENTALGAQFTQAAGQQILIGNTNTTLGATGTLTSSAVGDTLTIVCKTANTIWRVTSMVGNWTPA